MRVYHLLSRALVTRGFVKTRERRQIRYDWVIDMSARLVYSVHYIHICIQVLSEASLSCYQLENSFKLSVYNVDFQK